ncbi:MAG: dockerin type I repeat-containing protein [Ruminococcus sp.]|nr:dockerin type I repeat-containing protein [Ruminococcus sp.]
MKKRKIISAAAAVMMAAVTIAPQLPSAFPAARICTPITAEAAKNEVRIKVVDMATDMPIDNVDVAASTVKDFSREDSSFSWNTSDVVEFPIEGAYNDDWYVKLYNVPEEYNYNSVYTIDRDTRTYGDYTIRLVKKSQDNNVTICSAHDEPVAKVLLKTADMDVYDKKGNWFCTVRSNEGAYLPDGEYSVKFKEDILKKTGICVNGEASQDLTIKDGVPTDMIFFYLASDEEKEPNISFTIKNEGEDTSTAEGLGRVVITGDGFTLDTDGAAYLGDGHYTAHRYNFPKNGFSQTGNEERDRNNIDIIADSLLNTVEDIEFDVVDGKPDRDLVFVKVPVNNTDEEKTGSTAKVKIVDKSTGKNIEGVDAVAISGLNATAKSIAKWNTSDEAEKSLTGLAGDPRIVYGIELSNVPKEYEYNKQYTFSFAKDSKEESWVVELEKKNGTVAEESASAKIKIIDMATGKNIEGIDVEVIAGINATGKSIAKWNTSDEAVKTLEGLSENKNVAYGIKLKKVPEKYVHENTYVFMRTGDKDTENWTISLVTSDIKENITFNIYDWSEETWYDFLGKDMPFYAEITDKDGNFCYGFSKADSRALPDGEYTFRLVTPPEGYVIVDPDSDLAKKLKEKFLLSEVDGGTVNFTMKDGKPDREIIFDIIKAEDAEPVNVPAEEKGDIGFRLYSRYKGLWDRKDNGMVGYVIITDGADNFIGKYKLDEMISLPDGKYKAEIEVNSKGYGCFSEQKIQFTVDEGKAVEKLDFNVERWNFNESGSGDANGDGTVDISDAVLIMQSQSNPSKYGTNGTDKGHLTEDGSKRADVDGGGVTNKDALTIQQYLLGMFRFE